MLSSHAGLLLVCLAALFAGGESVGSAADRLKIVRDILAQGPIKLVRPDGAEGAGSAVKITVGFNLISIAKVDRNSGRFDTVGWLTQSWTDPRLAFNGNGQTNIRMRSSHIWTPDLEVFNAGGSGVNVLTRKLLAVVTEDGQTTLVPQMSIPAVCDMTSGTSNLNCTIKIGSWAYPGTEVDLELTSSSGVDLADYMPSAHWILRDTAAVRHVKHYACCPEAYVTLAFSFSLERRRR